MTKVPKGKYPSTKWGKEPRVPEGLEEGRRQTVKRENSCSLQERLKEVRKEGGGK